MEMKTLREFVNNVLYEDTITISVSGDVMFGRYVGYTYHPLNIDNPLRQTQRIFRNSDLSIINLETPFYDGKPTWWEKYPLPGSKYQKTLVAPTNKVNDLVSSGINMVSLANNHADDAGYEGFASTRSTLDSAGLIHAGTALDDPFTPTTISVRDKTVIFFSVKT